MLPRHIGTSAEQVVVRYLLDHGVRVLETNLRLGYLEIDIVAREGRVIAVVEVRARGAGAYTSPFGSVDGLKRRRLRHAGERLWNRRFRRDHRVDRLRFDVAAVHLDTGEVEYVRAAF